jgi:hypothetical protein
MGYPILRALCLGVSLLVLGSGSSYGEIHWKGRSGRVARLDRAEPAKTMAAGRRHLVLDFIEPPGLEMIETLAQRGLKVVTYLPDTGVIVAVQGPVTLTGLPLSGSGVLSAADKWSPALDDPEYAQRNDVIVEFHRDVPVHEQRGLILDLGLRIQEYAGIARGHLLVTGPREDLRRLTEWDEVAYIFPAPPMLASGVSLVACGGASAPAGFIGQLTSKVGEGWDGPGLNEAALTYSIQTYSQKVTPQQVNAALTGALAKWSAVAKVTFTPASGTSGVKNINVLFGPRDHGDSYPFDGPGGVLAHTFYPSPPNPEPFAGDLHMDEEENWNIGSNVDVQSVFLHELGHALGLGHSDVPGAVMYPYYRIATDLTAEDISAIQSLYAPLGGSSGPPGTVAVQFQTIPAGLQLIIDGQTVSAASALSFHWAVGSQHTVSVVTPQTQSGIRYRFSSWSDGRATSHTIVAPSAAATYTGTFVVDTAQVSGVSVNPSAGGTGRQLFQFVSRHASGANSIQYAQFLFSKLGLSAFNACYVSYDPASNVFYLLSDDMTLWYGLAGGSSYSIGNSQCTIHGAASGSSKSGTDLTTRLDLSFRSGFQGTKGIYQAAGDFQGTTTTGWVLMGTWSDTGDTQLELSSMTPNTGQGAAQTFTAVWKGGSGGNSVLFSALLVNDRIDARNACLIHYDRASNVFFLLNNDMSAWLGMVAGSATQIENSQCVLKGSGSGGTVSGNTLTIRYNLEFKPSFSGLRNFYMQAADTAGVIQVWTKIGSWTR